MHKLRRRILLLATVVATMLVAAALAPTAGATEPDQARIIGGTKPSFELYQSQLRSTVALISMNAPSQYDGQFCGGMLIDDNHVLTAGHCVVENSPYKYRSAPSSFRVLVGARNLDESSLNAAQLVPVVGIYVHPYFNLDTFRYDAAILRLGRSITNVPTLPLLTDAESAALGLDSNEVDALSAGWGDTDVNDDECCYPPYLMALQQTIHTAASCRSNLLDSPTWRFNSAIQLCSGAWGRDTCQGDSGGPLQVQVDGQPRLAGLVSHGVGCGEGFYGIYTRASAIAPWIASIPGVVDGDVRDPSHGPDDSVAPVVTATPADYRRVRLTITPGAGPTPTAYTVWQRRGDAANAEDVFLGSFTTTSFTVPLPPRRTTATSRLLVRSVGANGESPAALRRTGPRIDTLRPSTPRLLKASYAKRRLTATWRASIDRQSGIAGYDVQRRVGSRWGAIKRVTALRVTLRASAPGAVRVRARDRAGNTSAWTRAVRY